MTKYLLWKIKPGKETVWRTWCDEVESKHRAEAIETLKEENLTRERNLIFGPDESGVSYVLYQHWSPGETKKLPANLDRELNRKHFDMMKECLEPIKGSSAVVGYDLKV